MMYFRSKTSCIYIYFHKWSFSFHSHFLFVLHFVCCFRLVNWKQLQAAEPSTNEPDWRVCIKILKAVCTIIFRGAVLTLRPIAKRFGSCHRNPKSFTSATWHPYPFSCFIFRVDNFTFSYWVKSLSIHSTRPCKPWCTRLKNKILVCNDEFNSFSLV